MEENNQVDEIKEPKKIEVVTGDGNLNISPVYEHIEVEKRSRIMLQKKMMKSKKWFPVIWKPPFFILKSYIAS